MFDARRARWLIVVRRDHPERYTAASTRFDPDRYRVILDQRREDRRQQNAPVGADRRNRERRRPLSDQERRQWDRSGYLVVYRAEGFTEPEA